jgi:putative ABC transport system permease protein
LNIFLEFKESLLISFRAITSNKLRTFLATLGIVIGVSAVTIMQTAIEGINQAFEKSISAVGSDVLYIQKFEWFSNEDFNVMRNRKDITLEQYAYLNRSLQNYSSMSPMVSSGQSLKYKDLVLENVQTIGTTNEYQNTIGASVFDGRFFNQRESDGGYPITVIGYDVMTAFFPNENPVGKEIKIGGYNFRVIGVLEKQGSLLGMSFDNRVIIPMNRFISIFGTKRSLTVLVKAPGIQEMENTKEEINSIMRKARKIHLGKRNDFGINQQEGFRSTYESLTALIKIIGLAITALSLVVGSIGIANIMFVSVKERTKEIGVRKAIGAKRRTILLQFLIESCVICFLGGIIGIMIAFPISLIINAFVMPTVLPLWVAVVSIMVSVFFGVLSGFFPAFQASKMDPVDALRYE